MPIETTTNVRIATPAELRGLLLATAVGMLESRITVSQANAVVGLSAEVHKSIRQEYEMRCYASEAITIDGGKIIERLLG